MVVNLTNKQKGENQKSLDDFPKELRKEILILYELGLEQYEVDYLVSQKLRDKVRVKWNQQNPMQNQI